MGDTDFTVEGWFHIPLQRKQTTMTTHTQEVIEGVLFCVTNEFNELNQLIRKHMVRADLVRG